ncbi:thiolase family protein [Pseudarthrobacter phenanthrenivorans]|uniref:Acetyl-CoA acetyltransferase n=1 Tax=Pseudarthrobacter phenanthrenivorans TaxID=361575 RepID=A0A0B4CLZ4_PSEPS|nr:thiolase family protein [Pseudarthrobacter phenanthrenivorans]KIC62254.1 acetyl-CoA acetyltransferase [Pseudarthrobacter phenanthrenivorans]
MADELLPPGRQPVIIAARRTPVCPVNGALRSLRAHELLAPVLRALVDGLELDPASVADVVIGNAVGGGGNVARLALLDAGLPATVPGITVDRQCGSGLDAIALAARLVAAGGSEVYLAGGVESTSTAPVRANRTEDGGLEFYRRAQFVPADFGDPDMGVAAETVAGEYGVGRDRQDEFALASHKKALTAIREGRFEAELVPMDTAAGPVSVDAGPRSGLTPAIMARFPAAFVPGGTVTAGNSCFDADGASAVVITSLQRARELGAPDGLLVRGTATAGVDPQLLGIGAVPAARQVLAGAGVSAGDVELVEFNEAFASQTLACLDQLAVDPARVNLDGGALALGHAYGASGAVLVTRLLAQARRTADPGALALAMISMAGGMGTAALLEYRLLADA